MKLILSVLLALTIASVSSQTFISENFSAGQMPPAGWSIDQFGSYWTISQSTNAGGITPEGRFSYSTATPITTRLISPEVDLTGLASVKLTFNHFFDWYANPGPSLGIATRSGSAGTWQTVWSITPFGNVGPLQYSLDIASSDVGSSQFQFCFFISGATTMMDNWYVDDIILLNPLETNAGLMTISQTPSVFSAPAEVIGTLKNLGSDTITTAEIAWQLDGGAVQTSFFDNLNLKTLDSYEFTCSELMNTYIGLHSLKVWVGSVNGQADQDPGNDTLSKIVNKVCYTVPKVPLFEEFTSSTCIPCAFFNSDFVPWCDEYKDDITLIKYQMNFPVPGDPYYIEECGIRANYYGVLWVPWLVGNGNFVDTEMNDVNAMFQAESAQPGLMKIQATHTLAGQNMTVNVNVLPFVNQSACSLFIAVIEGVTHNNTGNNGETSFEHVLMKMIPGATGIPVDLQERVAYSYSATVNLSSTNIEDWDDIKVVAWVQKNASKKIFQSAYSTGNASFNNEDRLNDILLDGVSLMGFQPDQLSYNYGVAAGSGVPEVTGIPFDTSAIVIVVPALSIPGTTTIDVYAENIQYHKQYNLNFFLNTGLVENERNSFSVYPNPATEYVYIYGAENFSISITDAVGKQHRHINSFSGDRISLKGLPAGVYFLKAEKAGCKAMIRKVIIIE